MQQAKALFGELACVALLLILCLAVGLPRYRSNLDLRDEGFLAYGAVRVMEGQVPNLDFVSLQPPLSFYTTALVFKLLGTSLLSMRILGLALYVLIPGLIYAIARPLAGRWLALAAALPATILGLPFFAFVPYAIWQGIAASLGAALLFLHATSETRPRPNLAFPAGLLTAAAVLFRHDQGFYLVVSLIAYVLLLKFAKAKPPLARITGLWLLGIVTLLLPFGIYWLVKGALPEMFKQLVLFPLTTYSKTSSVPWPSLLRESSLQGKAVAALYFVPPIIAVVMAVWLGRRMLRRVFLPSDAATAFILIWAALYYCQVLARSDTFHLLTTLPPFFILCACGWQTLLQILPAGEGRARPSRTANGGAGPLRPFASLFAGAIAVSFLFVVAPFFVPAPLPEAETLQLPRAGVRQLGAASFKKFVERVQSLAPPDRTILCLPYQPMFYFLCDRRNPTRWNYLWPGDQTPADHQALIRQAERDPPAVVVLTDESDMRRYAPEILDYVHARYGLAFGAGGTFTVYARLETGPVKDLAPAPPGSQ